MTVLITGAAGFIGSHLTESLLANSHTVIGLDNFCDFYDPVIKEQNIAPSLANPDFTLIRADIRDVEAMNQLFAKHEIDCLVHLAAMAGVRPSIKNPQLYTSVNINGTVNLLDACRHNDVKNVVFASSSSVYGNNKKVPFSESDSVDLPISPYAATKKAGELLCHTYHHLFGMSISCLRFFTVFGPRQRPDLAIHKFSRKIVNEEVIDVFGDGTTKRDYTYITDILDGINKAIRYTCSGNRFDIFNLGESRTIDLKTMIATIEKHLGKKARKNQLSMQPGDVEQTFADVSKSKKILGYNPQTSFDEGIALFVDWLRGEEKIGNR